MMFSEIPGYVYEISEIPDYVEEMLMGCLRSNQTKVIGLKEIVMIPDDVEEISGNFCDV